MNLLESLMVVYEATQHLSQGKSLERARKRVAKKIEQLNAQRARRHAKGELVATVIPILPGNPNN